MIFAGHDYYWLIRLLHAPDFMTMITANIKLQTEF